MDWGPLAYVIALAAGVAAGFINTLAGSGSALTIPALILLGLPATEANATNRVGILLASIVAVKTFPSDFMLPRRDLAWVIAPAAVGAIGGAQLAAVLDPAIMNRVVGGLMLIVLIMILSDPRRLLRETLRAPDPRRASSVALLVVIGAYGGFIQVGVGVFLLLLLVLNVGLDLRRANAVKLLVVLVFSAPVLVVFAAHGQVHWDLGLLMAAGQGAGAFLAARFATRSERADVWIQRLVALVLAATAYKLLLT